MAPLRSACANKLRLRLGMPENNNLTELCVVVTKRDATELYSPSPQLNATYLTECDAATAASMERLATTRVHRPPHRPASLATSRIDEWSACNCRAGPPF